MSPCRSAILGYGVYIPSYCVELQEIASHHGRNAARYAPLKCKSVPGIDEDATTMAVEAARRCTFSHVESFSDGPALCVAADAVLTLPCGGRMEAE